MRRVRNFGSILILALLLLASCRSYYESLYLSNDLDEKFKGALDYYQQGKYLKAAKLFESMILLSQGTEKEDSVHYYNAMSNYRYGDFITAEANFNKFLEVFPTSSFAEEARFLRIKCLYEGTYRWELDQVPTQRAMAIIAEFMYDNPKSEYYPICRAMMDEFQERLDRKAYEAAKLYYTMKDYKSSQYAFRNVLRDNADNIYRDQILYYTALSSYNYALNSVKEKQKERYMSFVDDYYNYVGEFPNTAERKELDNLFSRAQRYLGGGAALDSAKVELATTGEVTPSKRAKRAERQNIKRAIKDAKRAVKEAESRNAVARKIEEEASAKSKRQSERKKARQEREEALRIYNEAKAKQQQQQQQQQQQNKQ